jgi:hypothetical protein
MGEMIEAVARRMKHPSLKWRETGSVTKDQKFNSISEHWFLKTKDWHGDDVSADGSKFIKRNTRVRVKLVEGNGINAMSGEEEFCVVTVFT